MAQRADENPQTSARSEGGAYATAQRPLGDTSFSTKKRKTQAQAHGASTEAKRRRQKESDDTIGSTSVQV